MARRPLYTTQATVRGGRNGGRGRTSDGRLDVTLALPKEMGGDGDGTNPEQLFCVGYAACFESALALAARRERRELGDAWIDAHVDLLQDLREEYALHISLHVSLPDVPAVDAVRLVRAAHAVCPYSRALKGEVVVHITANGATI